MLCKKIQKVETNGFVMQSRRPGSCICGLRYRAKGITIPSYDHSYSKSVIQLGIVWVCRETRTSHDMLKAETLVFVCVGQGIWPASLWGFSCRYFPSHTWDTGLPSRTEHCYAPSCSGQNSDLQVCVSNALDTEPLSQPQLDFFRFLQYLFFENVSQNWQNQSEARVSIKIPLCCHFYIITYFCMQQAQTLRVQILKSLLF